MSNTTLTELEKDVITNGIGGSDFYDYDCADIWSDCIVDTCKTTTKDQISGVVSSLSKKGLIIVSDKNTSEASVKFTEAGLKLYKGE